MTEEAGRSQGRSRWNKAKYLEKLGLVLGSVVVSLLILEVAIHIIETRSGPLFLVGLGNPIVQPHAVLEREHVPNSNYRVRSPDHPSGYKDLRTNNLGLREDEDTSVKKLSGSYRILVLGDSQTDGFVENSESWPNVLEHLLNEGSLRTNGGHYEVLNAGVVAYRPIEYYLWWRIYGRQLQPDLVMVGYFVGNDLGDAGGGRLIRQADGVWQLNENPRPLRQEPPRQRLFRTCRLCMLTISIVRGSPLETWAMRLGLVDSLTDEEKAVRLCAGCLWTSLNQIRMLEGDPVRYQADLAITEEILRRLRDEVEAVGAKLVVVIIPSKLQVAGDNSGVGKETAKILKMKLDPQFEERVEEDVIALLDLNEISTINTHPKLLSIYSDQGEDLYYEYDWHLNVRGNQLVGEIIYQELIQLNINLD